VLSAVEPDRGLGEVRKPADVVVVAVGQQEQVRGLGQAGCEGLLGAEGDLQDPEREAGEAALDGRGAQAAVHEHQAIGVVEQTDGVDHVDRAGEIAVVQHPVPSLRQEAGRHGLDRDPGLHVDWGSGEIDGECRDHDPGACRACPVRGRHPVAESGERQHDCGVSPER
jgi:hypothetical protein